MFPAVMRHSRAPLPCATARRPDATVRPQSSDSGPLQRPDTPMAKSDNDRYLAALAKVRAPAVKEAERLLDQGRYDEAEQVIRAKDNSIYGGIEIEKLFRRRLERLVAGGVNDGNRARAEELYHRALSWGMGNFPEPHTQTEAASFEQGRAEVRSGLTRLLGYEPKGR
jgi:hypothetical protein